MIRQFLTAKPTEAGLLVCEVRTQIAEGVPKNVSAVFVGALQYLVAACTQQTLTRPGVKVISLDFLKEGGSLIP